MEEPSSSPIVFCIGALVIAACSGPALKEEFRRPDPSYYCHWGMLAEMAGRTLVFVRNRGLKREQ